MSEKKQFEGFSSSLQSLIRNINKSYSKGEDLAVMDLSVNQRKIETICSFGSLGVDLASGIGGIPKGRVIEIYGPESSGKTTLCLHALVENQKKGNVSAFIDAEHAFDPNYFEALGGDLSRLIFSQPSSGEQALNIVEKLAVSGEVSIIVVDSVAALVPQSELNGEMEDHSVGVAARLMSRALRKLTAVLNQTGTTVIFINQLRQKIGIVFGSPETTTGGEALKFYSSIRIDIRRKGINKHTENGKEIKDSNATKVKIIKNKVAPPFKECEFDIVYGLGIDRTSELPAVAEALGLLTLKKGKFYLVPPFPELSVWGDDVDIESTINYIKEALKDPEVWYLKEELEMYVDYKLNQLSEEDLLKRLKELEVKYTQKEVEFEKAWEIGSEASSKSDHIKALYWLGKALEVKPWEKVCRQRFVAVTKRVEDRMEKGEELNPWVNGLDGNEYDVFTGEVRSFQIEEPTNQEEA